MGSDCIKTERMEFLVSPVGRTLFIYPNVPARMDEHYWVAMERVGFGARAGFL